jgi:hypothetical protein
MAQLGSVLNHPLGKRLFPADVAAKLALLWAERDTFLTVLDRMPQTLCHGDAFRRNLFIQRDGAGREQITAIDWAFMGLWAVGEELVSLVHTNLYFFEVEFDKAKALDEIVYNDYLAGLYDVGWRGDPRVVRYGYAAASSMRYTLGYFDFWQDFALNMDERKTVWVKQTFGCSVESFCDHAADCFRFQLDLADEARALLEVVG